MQLAESYLDWNCTGLDCKFLWGQGNWNRSGVLRAQNNGQLSTEQTWSTHLFLPILEQLKHGLCNLLYWWMS